MKIDELIALAEHRLMSLNQEMATALQLGQIETIADLNVKIDETQNTLTALRNL
jgi:hypothetical protein